ncbi:MAG: hypothetical protein ACTSSD_19510 [Candidatus Thorarchaeota archaeon]
MTSITEKQAEYIEIMLTNRFANDMDQEAVARHLKQTGKKEVSELTISEASDLIGSLLHRDVEYTFVCGRKKPCQGKRDIRLTRLENSMHVCTIVQKE